MQESISSPTKGRKTKVTPLTVYPTEADAFWSRVDSSGGPDHCLFCGEPFEQNKNRTRAYCSQACAVRGYKANLRIQPGHQLEKTCVGCGVLFVAAHRTGQYCSIACYRKHSEDYQNYHSQHHGEHLLRERERYWADPERSRAHARSQFAANREERLAYNRDYYWAHREHCLEARSRRKRAIRRTKEGAYNVQEQA